MGWNTTLVIYNDALGDIEKDPEFGKNVANAVRELHGVQHTDRSTVDIPAGRHSNAGMAIETHHADRTALVSVGGNLGVLQMTAPGWDHHTLEGRERLLREWAREQGFRLVKASEKPRGPRQARKTPAKTSTQAAEADPS